MKLLGISGIAGSGKDTFAKFLGPLGASNVALADPLKRIAKDVYDFTDEQLWGPSEERNKLDPRYPREHTWATSTCSCCGAVRFKSAYEEIPPCFLTPRYCLQLLGTDFGRHCYGNTWVDKCLRTAKTLLADRRARYSFKTGIYERLETKDWIYEKATDDNRVKLVTVSDVRFKNEIEAIQKAGGKVVRVRRPGAGLGWAAGLHPSEAEQLAIPDSAFDFVVENDGTLEELQTKALQVGTSFV